MTAQSSPQLAYAIRPARAEDAPAIYALLATFSTEGKLLPRPVADIQARIANFLVAELDGAVAACGALRDFGGNLNEIRSLAVRRDLATSRGRGSVRSSCAPCWRRRSNAPAARRAAFSR